MQTPRERLFSRLMIDPVTGCLNWTGADNSYGYGVIRWDGRQQMTHRVMYELFAEPIPPGMQIDHLCGNKGCANVSHLEVVTQQENLRRRRFKLKDLAPCGHPYDSVEAGARRCGACRRKARWGNAHRNTPRTRK